MKTGHIGRRPGLEDENRRWVVIGLSSSQHTAFPEHLDGLVRSHGQSLFALLFVPNKKAKQ
ncbi:hypothetical protein [Brucella pseudogrignonensis]|uniref:Transposase n=1 Tax=Brucella pseudogrignonensis TaxID=419475 RepID=A0ABU1MC67_9HYPH|nr:hypothetical protein [Brucella pseudogrignonensis]